MADSLMGRVFIYQYSLFFLTLGIFIIFKYFFKIEKVMQYLNCLFFK